MAKESALRVLKGIEAPLEIVVTRDDISDEAAFRGTGVLELYAELFPPNERDDPDDLVRWVLSDDVGEPQHVTIDGREMSYQLDSRCFILRAGERAVGLGFFTHDHASRLIFCNHVGVAKARRDGGLALAFYRGMVDMLDELFPRNIGVVLEVERFDLVMLRGIIGQRERAPEQRIGADEATEIRKFLRVGWYHKLGYRFLCDATTLQPLSCRSPCLDPSLPSSRWADGEEDYWLMWQPRTGAAVLDAGELWRRAVETIHLEILAKSLVALDPVGRRGYWHYAATLVARTLRESAMMRIRLARYPGTDDLLSRWRRLAIDLPI
ncbi:hypothetical protein [Bradyrhizobium jicamae]|uniref:hypothetical protein n=1 Tax=Bradyrhizobium jicamae TaxID=280332 RepID=UPI001BAC653C|nr:hypothetical protein [Bradyrhizobium jicamae]MBR0931900.1 hypothetical protein [Bradyrhizobium jicamae]